jgi:hypothetical protein
MKNSLIIIGIIGLLLISNKKQHLQDISTNKTLDSIKIIDSNYNLIDIKLFNNQELEEYNVLFEKMAKNQKKLNKIIDNTMRASFFDKIKNWFN